jgi:hypothetical protein
MNPMDVGDNKKGVYLLQVIDHLTNEKTITRIIFK